MRYTLTVLDKRSGINIFENIPTSALGVTVMISRLVDISFEEAESITNTLNHCSGFTHTSKHYNITVSLDGR